MAVNSPVDNSSRRYSLEISVSENNLSHRLVVSYPENADVSDHLMVWVPTKSKKGDAFLVDSAQRDIEINESKEGGRKAFGLFIESVGTGAKNLVFEWDLPINEEEELAFVWQKQLGAPRVETELNFEYPPGIYRLISSDPNALLTKEGTLGYNASLSRDFILNVKWQVKN